MPNYERPEVRDLGSLSQLTEGLKDFTGSDGDILVLPGPDIPLGDAS